MIENIVVELDIPEAKKLADFASIFQDLDFCINCCLLLISHFESNNKDNVLVQSLWTSALISYVRCFAAGKRSGLSEDIFLKFEGEPIAAHKFYKDLRDKNIAHSVNPFEQVKIGAVLSPSNTKKEVMGIATLSMKHISTDIEGVKQLALLAKTLRDEVATFAKKAEEETLEAAKRIEIGELYKKPQLQITVPGPEQSRNSR